MTQLTKRIRFKGEVEGRDEGDRLLVEPGDVVLVKRGIPRALLMKCPDGCGDHLAVNLDPRTSKAWRMYERANRLTLYPSVWRDGGCGAHFLLWRNQIVWCGYKGAEDNSPPYDAELEARVLSSLSDLPQSDSDVAASIDEIPYDVDRALRKLTRDRKAKRVATRPDRYVLEVSAPQTKSEPTIPTERQDRRVGKWWQRIWRR